MSEIDYHFCIPADHPCLPGHFPGRPIVPGALILEQLRQALKQHRPDAKIIAMPQVKFQQPLLPEQNCHIHITPVEENIYKFKYLLEGKSIAYGQVVIGGHP